MKKKRKNMFANAKKHGNVHLLHRCKKLDKKIRSITRESTSRRIRAKVLRGGQQGLWQGVKAASNQKTSTILDQIEANSNLLTTPEQMAEAFAEFFKEKIINITTSVQIDPLTNNGEMLITSPPGNFFSYEKVKTRNDVT